MIEATESRLKRAAELAEYLRQNPREAKREPEELAAQFELDPAMVVQIQSRARVRWRSTDPAGPTLLERVQALAALIAKGVRGGVSNPYVFQVVAAVLTVGVYFAFRKGAVLGFLLWCGLQAWCLLMKPKFRHVLFASGLLWVGSAFMVFQAKNGAKMEAPFGWPVLSILAGFGMAFVNLLLGGIAVVVGGWVQIAIQRKKSATLSRQDLLMRMFELQQQLSSLPAEVPKRVHPWIAYARKNPLQTAAVLTFVVVSLEHLSVVMFHVDPFALAQFEKHQQGNQMKIGNANVVSPIGISKYFLAVQFLLGGVSTVITIALGWLANTWRKVGLVLAGIFVGSALGSLLGFVIGAYGSLPSTEVLGAPFEELIGSLFWILIVRFVAGFNRTLMSYRVEVKPNEAAIVGELLEIRHRLSSNPTQICVLVVDAAGSTQMKKVADNLLVEYSFGRYQDWLGKIVAEQGGKVEIRTGDGAICAFGSAEAALAAAYRIQKGVQGFNDSENKLDLPFRLRVALHAGFVQANLEKVQFTEVIDVASHTEKHSPIGGIALTASFIQALPSIPDLPVCAMVDGFEVRAMSV